MGASGASGVVLVTGVARYLGAHLAARLVGDQRVTRVIGVDSSTPSEDLQAILGGVEVHRLDPATPVVAKLLVDAGVEVVVHLAVAASPDPGQDGRSAMKERNVIGTMQLLAACQQAPKLRGLVVRSSTAAYGASFRDPAVFTEDTSALGMPRGDYARDVLELEGYVRGFCRRRPRVATTVLRFAPFLDPQARAGLARYLANPVVPTVLGRDPRLQFVHVDDAIEVLHRATVTPHPGTYNVAGRGTLTLTQILRRAGRLPAPLLEQALSGASACARGAGTSGFSVDRLELLVHGRVVDTSRLVAEFGFEPRPTEVAVDDFLAKHRSGGPLGPEVAEAAERLIAEAASAKVDRRIAAGLNFLRERLSGDYEIDDFGFDQHLTDGVFLPALRQLYRTWFRVEVSGVEHLPHEGAALLVSNHSGTIAMDSLMLGVAIHDEHPAQRYLRVLGADFVFRMPGLSEIVRKWGGTLACSADAERLLGAGELVGVFPEGFKGVGKPFTERYKLQRFGRGGFVAAALRTGTPIIPVSIVGAEEIYPKIGDIWPLARLLGVPYFPVTPTFPWLGPLGMVPLPSKWLIEFGEPIETHELAGAADDPMAIFNLGDQVRETIQQTLYQLLKRRPDPFSA